MFEYVREGDPVDISNPDPIWGPWNFVGFTKK